MSQQNLEEDQEEPLKEQGDQNLKILGFHSPTHCLGFTVFGQRLGEIFLLCTRTVEVQRDTEAAVRVPGSKPALHHIRRPVAMAVCASVFPFVKFVAIPGMK